MIRIDDHATARAILRDATFRPIDLKAYLELLARETGRDYGALIHLAGSTPFFLDGARHLRLHILATRFFGAARLEAWRPTIAASVAREVERLSGRSRIDLMRDFVDPVLRAVVGAMLGIDTRDAARFEAWVRHARDLLEPMVSLRRIAVLQTAIGEMMAHIAATAAAPDAGTPVPLRTWLEGELDGDLTPADAVAFVTVLFVASQTTSQTVGNILLSILRLPQGERDAAAADWHRWTDDRMHDLLRLHASPQFVDRVASEDRTVGERLFRAGDHVHIHLPSVNRDPAVFGSGAAGCPLAAGQGRAHLSFGTGQHKCPGAAFARTIIGLAVPELLAAYADLHLIEDEVECMKATFIAAPSRLPCTA